MAELWIGTSGWVYKHWIDVLYPPKLPAGRYLPLYAAEFPTVEINRSYYRLPERSVFESWREQSPPGFLFAVKASRFLTHMKKLKDPEQPLERLMTAATGLGEKLAPVLFQFPRQWGINLERLDYFLAALGPYTGTRFAFEFRHASLARARGVRAAGAGRLRALPAGRLGHPTRRAGDRHVDVHPHARRRDDQRLLRRGAERVGRSRPRLSLARPRLLRLLQQ